MLSLQTILPDTLELLTGLTNEDILSGTRLVGGTALALQYGHRSSIDLDFFGTVEADADEVKVCLSKYGRVISRSVSKNIKCYSVNDVRVDIVNYQYGWIDDAVVDGKLRLASPKDIAAMKINAIEGRGSKKDFIDIYFLLQHFSLREIMDFYFKKYPEHSEFRALMSLSYFDDADEQMMPRMFSQVTWQEIKDAVSASVKAY